MRRGVFVALVLLGFVVAGACSAVGLARDPAAPVVPAPAPAPTPVPAATPSAAVAAPVASKPAAKKAKTKAVRPAPYIAARVTIARVPVAGRDQAAAAKAVRTAFARPLPIVVDGAIVRLDPRKFATVYVKPAVSRAHVAAAGSNVDLAVSVRGPAVRAYVDRLAKRFDRKSVAASLTLRAGQPFISRDRLGHRLDKGALVAGIVHALVGNARAPLRVKTKTIKPGLTRSQLGPVVLINRSLNRLTYFAQGLVRRFPIATGQQIYPTPAGRFQIVVKWRNPWWYPPTYDSWAKGLSPVPPGPGNPLGTRWMGLSARGVGIHGTNNPSSIGYSASHGCIRMQVPDAEWLFDHVGIGTTVFIV
jgi:lipoprotein-anchoring transpeptidase ErfK/SrfK